MIQLFILLVGICIGIGLTIYDIRRNEGSIFSKIFKIRKATSPQSISNKKFFPKHVRQNSNKHNTNQVEKQHTFKEISQQTEDINNQQDQLRQVEKFHLNKETQTMYVKRNKQEVEQILEAEYVKYLERGLNKFIPDDIDTLTQIYHNKVKRIHFHTIEIELKSSIHTEYLLENQKTQLVLLVKFAEDHPSTLPVLKIQNTYELYNYQITILEKKLDENYSSLFSFLLEIEDILFEFDQQKFRKFEQYIHDQLQSTNFKTTTQGISQTIQSFEKKEIISSQKISQEVSKRENQDQNQFKKIILGKFNQIDHLFCPDQELQQASKLDYDEEDNDDDDIFLNQPQPLEICNFSRFVQDFEEIQKIGAGGFGKVYKAKNRLDGNYYAIKQILLDYDDQKLCQKTKNEAIFLSRLQHIHIVRYYQSWTEEAQKNKRKYTTQVDSHSSDSEQPVKKIANQQSRRQISNKKLSDEDIIQNTGVFASSKTINEINEHVSPGSGGSGQIEYDSEEQDFDEPNYNEDDINIQWEENGDANQISEDDDTQKDQTLNKTKSKTLIKQHSQRLISHHDVPQFQYLYIQMEYCKEKTLKDWIDSKLLDAQQKKNIISQILEALSYLHQKRYIHRDLKPQNIFLDVALNVKLGDFGLATELKSEVKNEKAHMGQLSRALSVNEDLNDVHLNELTRNIGTTLYLAPEQEHSSAYDQKVDMFSLGIIMFEMYYEFRTDMEKYKILFDLKNQNIFPADFDKRVGAESNDVREKIKSLIQKDSRKRPESKEFLLEYQDTQFQDQIRYIVQSKNSDYKTMIQKLFDAKLFQNSVRINLDLNNTYLEVFMLLKKEKLKENILWKEFVKESLLFDTELEHLFKRYGAHRYDMNNLCLANNLVVLKKLDDSISTFQLSNPRVVYLLTDQGVMLQYSNNFIEPLIQIMNSEYTQNSIKQLRRYSFAEIMRHNPAQLNFQDRRKAIAYDIIWTQKLEEDDLTPLYISELFALTIDILNVLVDSHNYIIKISHTQLFECIVRGLHINEDFIIRFYRSNEIQTKIKRYYSTKSDQDQDDIYELLQTKFSMNKIDAHKFLFLILLRDSSPQAMIDQIKEYIVDPENGVHVMSIFSQLNQFYQMIQMTMNSNIVIQFETFSFAETRHFYQGIHFELVEKVQQPQNKKSHIFDIVSSRSIQHVPTTLRSTRKLPTQIPYRQSDRKYQELSLIVGGSYSNYLNNHSGCGIQIQTEILLFRRFCKYLIEKRHSDFIKFQAVKQTQQIYLQKTFQIDVVIYSEVGELLISEKLKLALQLRRAGFSAIFIPIGTKPKFGQFQFKLQVYLKKRGKEIKGRIKWADPKIKSDHEFNWESLLENIISKLKREIE